MKKPGAIIILFILLTACKKDKLKGEYAQLEGKWKLKFIVKRETYTGFPSTYDTITENQIPNSYQLEFLKCGKLVQLKDGQKVRKDRIVFNNFFLDDCYSFDTGYRFVIYLNNDKEDRFVGCVKGDSLSTSRAHISDDYAGYTISNLEVTYEYLYLRE